MNDDDVSLHDVRLSGGEAAELAGVLDHLFVWLAATPALDDLLERHAGDAGHARWLRGELDAWSGLLQRRAAP